MSTPPITRLFLAALLFGACGGPDPGSDENQPDASDGVELCQPSDEGGALMPLHLGKAGDAGFVDLNDGDEVELAWGVQGFLMVIRDLAVEADVAGAEAEDAVCFQCRLSISSPTGAFDDVMFDHMFPFSRTAGDLHSTQTILILTEDPTTYDGVPARLSARCDGHERSGEVERTINLTVPPPPGGA